jgi:hypothetical protein
MLGHGIGMVEDLQGLSRFLRHAGELTAAGGRILVHSLDVRRTDDRAHLAFHDTLRRAGRYIGETRIRFEYQGARGPYCGWLHVDGETLGDCAARAGWECAIISDQEAGDYLACLTR